jgi:hypothetical protein
MGQVGKRGELTKRVMCCLGFGDQSAKLLHCCGEVPLLEPGRTDPPESAHPGNEVVSDFVGEPVERTVPFGFLVQTLVIIWYALSGYHPDDITSRHAAEPWYDHNTEPAFEDMLAKLRRTLIAARFSAVTPDRADPNIIRDYELAWAAAAA